MPSVDGIVSGIDTTGLINAIIGAKSVPVRKVEDQIEDFTNRREKVSGLSNRMKDLQTAIEAMDEEKEFRGRKARTSSADQFSLDVTSAAAFGTYDIRVENLAKTETEVSQGYADADALGAIPEGTLLINYGGATYSITVDSTNRSLSSLASQLASQAGLSASVIDTGESGSDRYRLMVSGQDSGAANTISFDTSGLTGLTGTVPTFTEEQAADDARIALNGVTVRSATNEFSSLLPGLSLTALAEGTEAVSVGVERDPKGMIDRGKAFVKAYNDVISYYNTNTAFNADANIAGPLLGESTSRRAVEQLGQMVGAQYGTGTLDSLAQFGFKTERDGTISLDETAYSEALEDSEDDLVALFTSSTGALPMMRDTIRDTFVDADTGSLASMSKSLESTIQSMQDWVTDTNDRLDTYAEGLRKRFTSMEQSLGSIQSSRSFLTSLFGSTT